MGRWTPLVLMAGGLAILLGTLLGINFPWNGTNTQQLSSTGKSSEVLPANINVNSTESGTTDGASPNNNQVPQSNNNNTTAGTRIKSATQTPVTTAQSNQPADTSPDSDTTIISPADTADTSDTSSEANQNNQPIRALW